VLQRVLFLHEELMILTSFPHKTLECDIDLYKKGEMGKVSCPDRLMLYLLGASQMKIGRYKKGAIWETLT
jgi:hypothetical protein